MLPLEDNECPIINIKSFYYFKIISIILWFVSSSLKISIMNIQIKCDFLFYFILFICRYEVSSFATSFHSNNKGSDIELSFITFFAIFQEVTVGKNEDLFKELWFGASCYPERFMLPNQGHGIIVERFSRYTSLKLYPWKQDIAQLQTIINKWTNK